MGFQGIVTREASRSEEFASWTRPCFSNEELRHVFDGGAAAMDDGGTRECQVNQPGPEEVERHLVGDPRRLGRDLVQHGEVVCRRLGKERFLVPGRAGEMPFCPALIPEM